MSWRPAAAAMAALRGNTDMCDGVLFLALCTKGYGESLLGLRIADELSARGVPSAFVNHEAAEPVLRSAGYPHLTVSDAVGAMLPVMVRAMVRKHRPRAIVLSDYATATIHMERHGLDPSFLWDFGIPVAGIDTWDMRRTGVEIDLFGSDCRVISDWFERLDVVLTPAPMAPVEPNGTVYQCLPRVPVVPESAVRDLRGSLGVTEGDRLVLTCSAGWQHARYRSEHGKRLARSFPELMVNLVRNVDKRVHMVHVGPCQYELEDEGRYVWVPPLDPAKFDLLLASADLLVGANVSSTTISRAMAMGTPNLVLVNSHALERAEGLAAIGYERCEEVVSWVARNTPVYPFAMWPLGYHAYLAPLLRRNLYRGAAQVTEVLDGLRVQERIWRVLFDDEGRAGAVRRQERYVSRIREMAGGADLLLERLEEPPSGGGRAAESSV